jgi:hypothetical protein
VRAHSVEVRLNRKGGRFSYGTWVKVRLEEVTLTVLRILSEMKKEKHTILVGFDMVAEFLWISQECSSLSSHFTSWVDVQELLPHHPADHRIELLDAMNLMQITDRVDHIKAPKMHRPSNEPAFK